MARSETLYASIPSVSVLMVFRPLQTSEPNPSSDDVPVLAAVSPIGVLANALFIHLGILLAQTKSLLEQLMEGSCLMFRLQLRLWLSVLFVLNVGTFIAGSVYAEEAQSMGPVVKKAPLMVDAGTDLETKSILSENPDPGIQLDSEVSAAQESNVHHLRDPSKCCVNPKAKKRKDPYRGVFYDNDFKHLRDHSYQGPHWSDPLKGMLNQKLDIGGELRLRYHHENNHRGLGLTGQDDEFWLTRYRMYANYQLSKNFRMYGEYLYADSGGETLPNRTTEENRGEIQNLFLDAKLTDSTTLRVGRQELLLGSQRLVSPLNWANTRRTFQGGRLSISDRTWSVDGFFVHPVNRSVANESKIDDANESVDFYGLYATRKHTKIGSIDAYCLGLDDSDLDLQYHTVGARVWGDYSSGLRYEIEGGVQFGDSGPGYGSHSAGFFTTGIGRQLKLCTSHGEWRPTVWFWYDWASGGDSIPAARNDDSFDHLFPLAHKYLGAMDLFGRRNLNDVNVQFLTPLSENIRFMVWYHYFFLDQKTTPYNVNLTPFNPTNTAGDRELGHEIDLLLTYEINARNNISVGYVHFDAGAYYETTPGVQKMNADFLYYQYVIRF